MVLPMMCCGLVLFLLWFQYCYAMVLLCFCDSLSLFCCGCSIVLLSFACGFAMVSVCLICFCHSVAISGRWRVMVTADLMGLLTLTLQGGASADSWKWEFGNETKSLFPQNPFRDQRFSQFSRSHFSDRESNQQHKMCKGKPWQKKGVFFRKLFTVQSVNI